MSETRVIRTGTFSAEARERFRRRRAQRFNDGRRLQRLGLQHLRHRLLDGGEIALLIIALLLGDVGDRRIQRARRAGIALAEHRLAQAAIARGPPDRYPRARFLGARRIASSTFARAVSACTPSSGSDASSRMRCTSAGPARLHHVAGSIASALLVHEEIGDAQRRRGWRSRRRTWRSRPMASQPPPLGGGDPAR